jgi:hypothetical protein
VVVCADVPRRRAGLDTVIGALGEASLVSWATLATQPELAEPFAHIVALDPPLAAAGVELLRATPGGGFAHLAWGEPEVEFALACAQAELDLRPPLAELYRGLRDAGGAVAGEELAALLAGAGAHPRSPSAAARMLTVLLELGLVTYENERCTLAEPGRVELERSPTYVRCQANLDEARRYLTGAAAPLPVAA